ncbi:hypothetical protein ACFWZJ_27095 [Streptomyces massasporeus]
MTRARLSRRETIALAGATLSGAISGMARAITAWLLEHLTP